MKNPWLIGALSLVPGLGLIALGEIRQGVIAAAITFGLVWLTVVAWPAETLATIIGTLALVAWITQILYAVAAAQRAQREAAGTLPIPRQDVPFIPPAGDASRAEITLAKMRHTVTQYLNPGEHVQVAVQGTIGTRPLYDILLSGSASATQVRMVYLAITRENFVLITSDAFGKPFELERIARERVALVGLREGPVTDDIVIRVDDAPQLSVRVPRLQRQGTRQLAGVLSGKEQETRAGAGSQLEAQTSPAIPTRTKGLFEDHPVFRAAYLGAVGGVWGSLIAGILMLVLSLIIAEIPGIPPRMDVTEAMGYLIGFYCLVMFPIGGALLGAIPGALLGIWKAARHEQVTKGPSILAGLLTIVILSVGAFLVMVFWP